MNHEQLDTSNQKHRNVKPVVRGSIQSRDDSFMKTVVKTFIKGNVTDIKRSIVHDWIVPFIEELFIGTLEMLFYETSFTKRSSSKADTGYTPYGSITRNGSRRVPISNETYEEPVKDYRDISYDNWIDAKKVYAELLSDIREYGYTSIGYLFSVSEISNDNFTLENYGWKSLPDKPSIIPRRGRYYLNLPKPVSLL